MAHPSTFLNDKRDYDAILQALAELPAEKKATYLEACERAPQVLEKESHPSRFIRVEKGSAKAAAERIAAYWECRKNVFGDRTFLPLDITGDGAMEEKDLELLRTGYLAFLLPHNMGHKVLHLNSKLAESVSAPRYGTSRLRCLFYMCSLAAEDEKPFVFLRLVDSTNYDKAKAANFLRFIQILPMTIVDFCCVYLPIHGARRIFEETVIPVMTQAISKYLGHLTSNVLGDSPSDIMAALVRKGYRIDGLPSEAGGMWERLRHLEWMEEQTSKDYAMYCASLPTIVPEKPADAESKLCVERKDRKRRMDAMYARNRRRRDREVEEDLQARTLVLTRINFDLIDEEKRLTDLLQSAKNKVAEIEAAQGRSQFQAVGKVPPPHASFGADVSTVYSSLEVPFQSVAEDALARHDLRARLANLLQAEKTRPAPSLAWPIYQGPGIAVPPLRPPLDSILDQQLSLEQHLLQAQQQEMDLRRRFQLSLLEPPESMAYLLSDQHRSLSLQMKSEEVQWQELLWRQQDPRLRPHEEFSRSNVELTSLVRHALAGQLQPSISDLELTLLRHALARK